jgi:hypothetical protein
VEVDPPGGDRRLSRRREHGRDGTGPAPESVRQGSAEGGVVFARDLVVHRHKRVDTRLVDDRPPFHAGGRRRVERQVGDLRDERRLGRLAREPGREEPFGSVCRPVM